MNPVQFIKLNNYYDRAGGGSRCGRRNWVVVVPCFDRAEFLTVAVEQLLKCKEAEKCLFVFAVDDRGPEMTAEKQGLQEEVIEAAMRSNVPEGLVIVTPPDANRRQRGNARNVFRGLMTAMEYDPQYVFYVEDDVFVADDFFRWHMAVHESWPNSQKAYWPNGTGQNKLPEYKPLFASVAHFDQNLSEDNWITLDEGRTPVYADSSESYFTHAFDYSALGCCLPAPTVRKILQHAVPEYFYGMEVYVRSKFPNSRLGAKWCDQDGLIRRLLESSGLRVAWPVVPRCFHAGWHGQNRMGERLQGSMEMRLMQLRSIMHDGEAMNGLARQYKDIVPCRLEGNKWDKVVHVADFTE